MSLVFTLWLEQIFPFGIINISRLQQWSAWLFSDILLSLFPQWIYDYSCFSPRGQLRLLHRVSNNRYIHLSWRGFFFLQETSDRYSSYFPSNRSVDCIFNLNYTIHWCDHFPKEIKRKCTNHSHFNPRANWRQTFCLHLQAWHWLDDSFSVG